MLILSVENKSSKYGDWSESSITRPWMGISIGSERGFGVKFVVVIVRVDFCVIVIGSLF